MGLGIKEARENLPSLVRRVVSEEEEITFGVRGKDEVTLVSTRKLNALRAELARLRERLRALNAEPPATPGRGEMPFAGLQRALEEGRLGGGYAAPRLRRVFHRDECRAHRRDVSAGITRRSP